MDLLQVVRVIKERLGEEIDCLLVHIHPYPEEIGLSNARYRLCLSRIGIGRNDVAKAGISGLLVDLFHLIVGKLQDYRLHPRGGEDIGYRSHRGTGNEVGAFYSSILHRLGRLKIAQVLPFDIIPGHPEPFHDGKPGPLSAASGPADGEPESFDIGNGARLHLILEDHEVFHIGPEHGDGTQFLIRLPLIDPDGVPGHLPEESLEDGQIHFLPLEHVDILP